MPPVDRASHAATCVSGWRVLKRARLALLCFAMGLAFAAGPADRVHAAPGAKAASFAADRFLDGMHAILRAGAPGVLARIRIGEQVWSHALGLARRSPQRRATTNDVWRIASVTKMITAHALVLLSDLKRVDLDHALARYEPHLPKRLARIKVSELLDQTSRVPDYLDHRVFGETSRDMVRSVRTSPDLDAAMSDRLAGTWDIDPLAEHQYANTNYALAGFVVEKATALPLHEAIGSLVFEPLKLKRTGFVAADGAVPEPAMHGYIRGDAEGRAFASRTDLIDVTQHSFFHGGDGGVYSNLAELAAVMDHIWVANARDGTMLARLTGNLRSDHDGFYRYGYGVMAVDLACKRRVFGHEGLDIGATTFAFANRDNTRQVVLVANLSTDANPKLDLAMRRLRDRVFCGE